LFLELTTVDDLGPISQATHAIDIARLAGGTEPIVVRADDSLHRLAELAVRNVACRVLSVVDDAQRLIGVVSVSDLLDDIFLKVVPEEFLGEIDDVADAMRYAGHIGARTAGDIMTAPVSVQGDETIRQVFRRLHQSGLNGLPVVDQHGRVIAYLDQLELMMAWIQITGREVLLRPAADGSDG
jgi:CBS-domain-containing membrane protein